MQILCDFAHASEATRDELLKHDCLSFYLSLMPQLYWKVRGAHVLTRVLEPSGFPAESLPSDVQAQAIAAISVCLANDVKRVEPVLCAHVTKLVGCQCSSGTRAPCTRHVTDHGFSPCAGDQHRRRCSSTTTSMTPTATNLSRSRDPSWTCSTSPLPSARCAPAGRYRDPVRTGRSTPRTPLECL
jgi:hypothetical protein